MCMRMFMCNVQCAVCRVLCGVQPFRAHCPPLPTAHQYLIASAAQHLRNTTAAIFRGASSFVNLPVRAR